MFNFPVHSRVRIVYGEHAGKTATVLSVTETGHFQYDYVAVRLTGSAAYGGGVESLGTTSPLFFFRFALDPIDDRLP